ncbi:chorismate mutase [Aquibacillus saliphilus]|uniref:chorismate mutase n=1 Tax=Aquibacillus saliphilus TaxID=1909422 RepID=UPI001CEFBABB|nr:chorismate mutase [Aquibacillus saliphilus]
MIRGIRGATTVDENRENTIIKNTKILIQEMVQTNKVIPEDIASVFISVTSDINDGFPAKALRLIDGWTYVPVMCMQEIDVPNSLEKCIRIMMTVNTEKNQKEVTHIYHNEAIKLRPDLSRK